MFVRYFYYRNYFFILLILKLLKNLFKKSEVGLEFENELSLNLLLL